MKLAEEYLNVELKDDSKLEGGVSFQGETLRNFLDEVQIPYNTPINVVNSHLIACGIQPIDPKLDLKHQVFEKLWDVLKCWMEENEIEGQNFTLKLIENYLPFKDEEEHQKWIDVCTSYKFFEDFEELTREIMYREVD